MLKGTASPGQPWIQGGKLIGANFNSTADQAITITSPAANYIIFRVRVANPSADMSTATVPLGGFYSGAGKTGITLVAASQSYAGLTSGAVNTGGSALVINGPGNLYANWSTIFFALSTAHGSACTADIYVDIIPLY